MFLVRRHESGQRDRGDGMTDAPTQTLPIAAARAACAAHLAAASNLVVVAEPGAGKTTLVPRWLLERLPKGEIWVLQPRRIAAKWAAAYVARGLGEAIGAQVGYRVRFERATGPTTRLIYMTEGLLSRALIADPQLAGVAAVVFDEFHVRSVEGDVGLALLLLLQRRTRPDLRLVAMSATLDPTPLVNLLHPCGLLQVAGRQFPVETSYLPHPDPRPLAVQVVAGLRRLAASGELGDTLIFLPGVGEIERVWRACESFAAAQGATRMALHGGQEPAAQDAVLAPCAGPKLIFCTNVAETSVTVPGVRTVVDAGLHRQATFEPYSGLNRLQLRPISQAAAQQRAGRAGRTGPGRCLRLYTRLDLQRRAPQEEPEVLRLDLSASTLLLSCLDAPAWEELPLLDRPSPAAQRQATATLEGLGACSADGALTALGRRLATQPLHPRLARLVAAGVAAGVGSEAAALAAWLSEGGGDSGRSRGAPCLSLEDAVQASRASPLLRRVAARLLPRAAQAKAARSDPHMALAQAALAGFVDRVAQRQGEGATYRFCRGGQVTVDEAVVGRDAAYVLVLAAHAGAGRAPPVARLATEIAVDGLLAAPLVHEHQGPVWEPTRRRVVWEQAIFYGELTLDRSRSDACDVVAAQPLLLRAARQANLLGQLPPALLASWRARLQWAEQLSLVAPLPSCDEAALVQALADACADKTTLPTTEDIWHHVQARWPMGLAQRLLKWFPKHVSLPHGAQVQVHYAVDRPPYLAAPLQKFFGQTQTPTVAQGRLPLTLHLLGPHGRALQITADLASFWRTTYPEQRRALMRRYPRHAWPESPQTATPPSRSR
jgi:ATP-dependent helicase HrpB